MADGNLNERQIDLRSTVTGNYPTLKDYLDGREVISGPFDFSLTAVDSDVVLLDSAEIGALVLAVGATTTQSFGAVVAAPLAGAVGTADSATFADGIGNLVNRIELRQSGSNDPLTVAAGDNKGKEVFGLLQVASTVSDGDAVAADASENTQMSFCYFDENDAIQTYELSNINAAGIDLEFNLSFVFSRRDLPTMYMTTGSGIVSGGGGGAGGSGDGSEVLEIEFKVDTGTEAAGYSLSVFDPDNTDGAVVLGELKDGVNADGATTIVNQPDQPITTEAGLKLGATADDTYGDHNFSVHLNGVRLPEGTGKAVEWVDANSLKINSILDAGDIILIRGSRV